MSLYQDLQRDQQFSSDLDTAIENGVNTAIRFIHTSNVGIIQSYDADTQTAQVQIALRRMLADGTSDLHALLIDVPVHFPQGGGWVLTFPIQPGDEGILVFSERSFDAWFVDGGLQDPLMDTQLHNIADAFILVGVNSQPRKLTGVSATACELRSKDGATAVSLEAGTITLRGNVVVQGTITAQDFITSPAGVKLGEHIHLLGVSPTQPPINPE